MTLQEDSIKVITKNVIMGKDYRMEIVDLINKEFLQFALDFFKKVVTVKMDCKDITIDRYKNAFLNEKLSSDEIAINAGLNKKTISNIYRSATKEIIIDASKEHFEVLYNSIKELAKQNKDIDFTLNIKLKDFPVSVDLNLIESLIVINTLAVKRAALRGGAWSSVGKQVEKVLMITLCRLFGVSDANFNAEHFIKDKKLLVDREVDFYLINGKNKYRCEVKLMGQGNPESADAIIARDSDAFIADILSGQNKNQCEKQGISWVCLRDKEGYKRFAFVLDKFSIPYIKYKGDLKKDIDLILQGLYH